MRYSIPSITALLLLSACAATDTKQPVCTGNLLRDCEPVLYFDTGSSALNKESKENLNWVIEKMKRFPKRNATLTGYSDSVGNPNKNFALSKNRAIAAKNYMAQHGIEKERIVVKFDGELKPICTQESCQALNRRVEVAVDTPNGAASDSSDWAVLHPNNWKCLLCEEE